MKRYIALIICVLLMLTGCTAAGTDEEPIEISPVTDSETSASKNVTLYFGDATLQYLIGEVRNISVPVNERLEEAVLKELIRGTACATGEIRSVINAGTKVVSVKETEGVLFVTLSSDFFNWPTTPGNKEAISDTQKQLAVYSIVNTMIEVSGCPSVQLLIDNSGSGMGQRIERKMAGFVGDGVLEPLSRNGAIVLTAGNTVAAMFSGLMAKDYDAVYRFVAQRRDDGSDKPLSGGFEDTLRKHGATIEDFSVRETVMGADNNHAVVMIDYSIRTDDTEARMRTNIPVKVVKENEVWKISYDMLVYVLLME